MKLAIASLASLVLTTIAAAQPAENRICAQGTYSWPCPRVIWCQSERCGVGIPRADGDLDIVSSTETKMNGTHKKPVLAGQPLSLQHLAGRVIVFEWEESGQAEQAGTTLPIKDILYVIMPAPHAEQAPAGSAPSK